MITMKNKTIISDRQVYYSSGLPPITAYHWIPKFEKMIILFCLLAGSFLLAGCNKTMKVAPAEEVGETILAERELANFPVIVSTNASETTRANAVVLSEYLGKMTGAKFSVEEGDGSTGIVLGCQENFTNLPKEFDADYGDPQRTEEYLLFTHPKGFLLVGASDLGAQDAMWDFLGRQGYRQYFPGENWEIIPSISTLNVSYNEIQKPDYIMRTVWFSGGAYPECKVKYLDWCKKNRGLSGFYINAGHSYESFIHRNEKIFQEHPEYYASVDGVHKGSKLNISNPDLRRLFVNHKLKELRDNPAKLSVSVDPSDGGGWDNSKNGKAIGTPSDQAVFLANEVAKAIGKEFPGHYVGMYAYNKHGEPPSIQVSSNIFVLVTTGFRGTSLSMQDQMQGWQKQGATLGIRDYLSYAASNYDVPMRCSGPFSFNNKKFKNYYDWGARLYSGESGNNWGINGLVYYNVARKLWNVEDSVSMETIFEEFLVNCFGPVADDIRIYYETLSPTGNPVLEPHTFRRLYDSIARARKKNPGNAIEARLDDLTVYVRYLELYRDYVSKKGTEREEAILILFSHLYRARLYTANAAYAIIRDLRGRDKTIRGAWPDDKEFKALRGGQVLREKRAPYSKDEIRAMVPEGIKNNKKLDFSPISYSKDLVPASSILGLDRDVIPGYLGHQSVHSVLYYTWAEDSESEWRIKITCANGGRRKITNINPKIELWAANEAMDEPVDVVQMNIGQGNTGEFILKSPHKGLHWIIVTGARWQKLELDQAKPWTVTSSLDIPSLSQGVTSPCNVYFYVPKNTKVIGGHFKGRGVLINPAGEAVKRFDHDGYVKVKVPEGMDGRLWKVQQLRGGSFSLMTVPPYFAPSPRDLLLPREVVENMLKN